MVEKYKQAFLNRLGDRIKKIPTSKLEKVLPKIDKIIERFEKNTKLSKERKERILSQLGALKEIIEDRLNEVQETQVDINIENLLN